MPKHAQDKISARKVLKAAQTKPGPKLPKPLVWSSYGSIPVTEPGYEGRHDGPTVELLARLGEARLKIDMNDGRCATVTLSAADLKWLIIGGTEAYFDIIAYIVEASEKKLAKTSKGRKAKRRG